MKRAITFLVACAALTAASAPAATASSDVWLTASAPNGLYTVDTPCAALEVEGYRQYPDSVFGGLSFIADTRVVCRQEKVVLLIGEIDVPDLPATGPSGFDSFVAQVTGDKTAEGKTSTFTVSGHRAFANTQESGDKVARVGFVELGRSKLLFVVAGIQEASGMTIPQQRALIDHFFTSIKVAAK